ARSTSISWCSRKTVSCGALSAFPSSPFHAAGPASICPWAPNWSPARARMTACWRLVLRWKQHSRSSAHMTIWQIAAEPAPVAIDPAETALIIIDMQKDFLYPDGYGAFLGNDVTLLQRTIAPIQALLAAA